ncbi:hypothetical protein [Glycomyces paridis]|uniref:Uncharacterized protein n=1 Tax=Glycomyces paridis TaxID=2126555 RepID=A0A4S8P8D9_9ACTN|nr:hypothetical protein [Glycomyces paridis]THV26483.1 hypothetical protein E9998_18150 [Glycomyces paridis]
MPAIAAAAAMRSAAVAKGPYQDGTPSRTYSATHSSASPEVAIAKRQPRSSTPGTTARSTARTVTARAYRNAPRPLAANTAADANRTAKSAEPRIASQYGPYQERGANCSHASTKPGFDSEPHPALASAAKSA